MIIYNSNKIASEPINKVAQLSNTISSNTPVKKQRIKRKHNKKLSKDSKKYLESLGFKIK